MRKLLDYLDNHFLFQLAIAVVVLLPLAWWTHSITTNTLPSSVSVCRRGEGYWTSLDGNLCVRTIGYPVRATCFLYTDTGAISCFPGNIIRPEEQ